MLFFDGISSMDPGKTDIGQALTTNHFVRMIGVAGRYVTEDFSRKVRKHREELIKFAKSLRNVEPDARSSNKFYLHF